MKDSLQWVAVYDDGSFLEQIDKDGNKHAYEHIDRKRLSRFLLYTGIEGTSPFFIAAFDGDGHKLIWRRRVQKLPSGEEYIVHIVGKKGHYVALIEQGGMVRIFDNFREDEAILVSPQLLDVERP